MISGFFLSLYAGDFLVCALDCVLEEGFLTAVFLTRFVVYLVLEFFIRSFQACYLGEMPCYYIIRPKYPVNINMRSDHDCQVKAVVSGQQTDISDPFGVLRYRVSVARRQ